MITYEEALETAVFFEKNVDTCTEYEDAWIFRNSKKRPGNYNPVIVMKRDGDACPVEVYKVTGYIGTKKITKEERLAVM